MDYFLFCGTGGVAIWIGYLGGQPPVWEGTYGEVPVPGDDTDDVAATAK